LQRHAAARTVGGQRDRRQLPACDANFAPCLDRVPRKIARFFGVFGDLHYSDKPPSTARTWPVMKPALCEQRKATAAAISSAVPSRLIGVSLTISPTISSVTEAVVRSVRT